MLSCKLVPGTLRNNKDKNAKKKNVFGTAQTLDKLQLKIITNKDTSVAN